MLEDEMTRLHENGFIWTDDYTQCVLQTALAAIRYEYVELSNVMIMIL